MLGRIMDKLTDLEAVRLGFSLDKRKRKNQHRTVALKLLRGGGFFNGYSARGSTFHIVALWHLNQARQLCN